MAGGAKTADGTKTADAPRPERGRPPGARRPGPAERPPRRPRLRLPRRLPGRRTVLLSLLLALVLGAFGMWVVYGSSWLLVERVSVTGTRELTDQQVRQAAGVPTGQPVASVDRAAAERRLTQRLPRLASAEVVRAWPHGIGLKVTERRPQLVEKQREKGAGFAEIDANGVRFATVQQPPKGVPRLDLKRTDTPAAHYFSALRLRGEAAKTVAALPARVAADTSVVRVRSYDSITLELTRGRTVLWGSGERGVAKARVLTALLKGAGKAQHFDVSVPGSPATGAS